MGEGNTEVGDGWCEGALVSREMTVKAVRQCATDRKKWRAQENM